MLDSGIKFEYRKYIRTLWRLKLSRVTWQLKFDASNAHPWFNSGIFWTRFFSIFNKHLPI